MTHPLYSRDERKEEKGGKARAKRTRRSGGKRKKRSNRFFPSSSLSLSPSLPFKGERCTRSQSGVPRDASPPPPFRGGWEKKERIENPPPSQLPIASSTQWPRFYFNSAGKQRMYAFLREGIFKFFSNSAPFSDPSV